MEKSVKVRQDHGSFNEVADDQSQSTTPIERCRREIAEIEALIRAGHADVQGLCLALSDWSEELRLLEAETQG
jgi:hypothetical protein